MDSTRDALAYAVFPTLSAIGFLTSMGYAWQNGLVGSLLDIASGRKQELPMSKARVIRKWTGVQPIDDYLAFYLAFFLPGLGRSTPNHSIQNRHFIGQFTAMWTLIQLQANKSESSPLIQASLLATGFGIQTIGAATIVPLFCALHLTTSVLATPTSSALVSEARTAAIPISVVSSILIPLLTATTARSHWVRQASINIWQVFYLFTEVIERAAAPALQSAIVAGTLGSPVSLVYSFAEGLATISHVATIGATLATKIVPGLFPKGFAQQVSFKTMFWPRFKLEKEGDMFEARLHFLRWDEWVSCSTFLAWATYLYVTALPAVPVTSQEYVMLAAKILVRVMLTGPIGAAAHLLRSRDMNLVKS